MRISLQRKTGRWTLSEMDEVHIGLLRMAAADASYGQSPEGRARLFPKPLVEDEAVLQEEFLEDWKEFVVDGLEDQFNGDVHTLRSDLEKAKPQRRDDSEGAGFLRLSLPLEHAPAWFSALNQARLMLDERYKFHGLQDEFVGQPPGAALDQDAMQERFTAYMRYEFFCMIQEWLVRFAL